MFFPLGDDYSQRRTIPYVVYLLVAVNAVMWFLQLTLGETFTYALCAVPFEITRNVDLVEAQAITVGGNAIRIPHEPGPSPIQLTLVTSMFLHGSWGHILGNMLYLWIFGDQIEDLLGHGRFLAFYLLSGIAAGLAQVAAGPESVVPCLGASGAIAGVLGAYLVRYPRNRVRVFFLRFLTTMPAFVVLGGWIALQLVAQVGTEGSMASGVAYMAHIGGFVAGLCLVFLFALRRRRLG